MLKSPNEVLSSFITAVSEEKELEFAMKHWLRSADGTNEARPYEIPNVCGTSACIAGTVAYRMDPKSDETCEVMIFQDVGLTLNDDWGELHVSAPLEEHKAHRSLGRIFSSQALYGRIYLSDISKEDVLMVLAQLVEGNYSSWESLNNELSRRIDTNGED